MSLALDALHRGGSGSGEWVSVTPAPTPPVERVCWDTLERAFFRGKALRRLIVHLCNSWGERSTDPISETLRMVLSTSLQPVLTDVGMVPFKDQMFHVMPYKKMTVRQLRLLDAAVGAVSATCDRVGASRQVGGGCVLLAFGKVSGMPSSGAAVDPLECLVQFCKAVMLCTDLGGESDGGDRVRVGVCNIILQRVGGVVRLPRATLTELERRLHQGQV